MKILRLFYLALFLLPSCTPAQETFPGQFGCAPDQRAALNDEILKFDALTSPLAIQKWKTRPVLEFGPFNAAKYGFTRAEFYRWHVPVAGREGYDRGAMSNSTDRLAMAVHLLGPRGEHWFELANVEQEDDSLFIQRRDLHESEAVSPEASAQDSAASSKPDEMDAWLRLQLATPDSQLPLFLLVYQHDSSGVYQTETIDHYILMDLRTGSPQINREVTCSTFEPIGGACSAQDEASETHNGIQCQWDATAGDFHCLMTAPYGSPHAVRLAQRVFYLLSNKPAKGSLGYEEPFADLGQLALRIRENPSSETEDAFVSELGSVTLLKRFKDLLPGSAVFVFASLGPGEMLNAHLSLVTLHGSDKPAIQVIPKWGIAGDATDEYKREFGLEVVPLTPDNLAGLGAPIPAADTYRVHILERKPGFSAFEVILNTLAEANSVHVVYWVGLEAVNGKLVVNAVRVAGDSYVYGGCGLEFHEATASLIKRKPGFAEATVRVQGPFEPEYTEPYPTEGPNCVWNGVLHWKSGAGFRVRKLGEDCEAAHQEVKITENGEISTQPGKQSP